MVLSTSCEEAPDYVQLKQEFEVMTPMQLMLRHGAHIELMGADTIVFELHDRKWSAGLDSNMIMTDVIIHERNKTGN